MGNDFYDCASIEGTTKVARVLAVSNAILTLILDPEFGELWERWLREGCQSAFNNNYDCIELIVAVQTHIIERLEKYMRTMFPGIHSTFATNDITNDDFLASYFSDDVFRQYSIIINSVFKKHKIS